MWYLQSGLNITSKGAKSSYSEEGFDVKTTLTTHYLEIPVLAAAKFDVSDNMKFVVNAGPYLAFGLGGKEKYELEMYLKVIKYSLRKMVQKKL